MIPLLNRGDLCTFAGSIQESVYYHIEYLFIKQSFILISTEKKI